ncbi:MAG: hypothetical protein ACOX1F_06175 [Erysipelotrichaceae bacterium]|jgi:hypothetical protein
MREPFYMVNDTVILNFSNEYHHNLSQLVSSGGFKLFLERYLKDLAMRDIVTFEWLTRNRKLEEMVNEMVVLTKQLLVLDIDEIYNPLVEVLNRMKTLFVVEDAYNYWRSKHRFSLINASSANLSFNSFIEADSKYNQLVLQLYRICQEKLHGRKNSVYRQMQAGTNGGCLVKRYRWQPYSNCSFLKNIVFINKVVLKTPMVLNFENSEVTAEFVKLDYAPIKNAGLNQLDWLCLPVKVGDLLCFVYIYKDFLASGLLLANLFEIAEEEECSRCKPDIIFIYGSQDEQNSCGYYYDDINNIFIGSVSYSFKIDCISFLKEAILKLHNLTKLNKKQLPIQGTMIRVCFLDRTVRSVVLIGDNVAGKMAIIEAVKKLSQLDNGNKRIIKTDVIFDDSVSFKMVNNHVAVNGSETGSLINISQLDKTAGYKDLERTIFINPETKDSKAIVPITTYNLICAPHRIDMVLYIDDGEDKNGLEKLNDLKSNWEVFISKSKINSEKEPTKRVFTDIFSQLISDSVYIGQLYIKNKEVKDDIIEAVRQLLSKMKEI